jgi:hypothetical protein
MGDAAHIEALFPRLKSNDYDVTSPKWDGQNCIGHALYADLYFDPGIGGFIEGVVWPDGIRRDDTVEAWTELFGLHAYQECESADLEPGAEKIAIYAGPDGEAWHVARQLESGEWTSKLNKLEDIRHRSLDVLIGDDYRAVVKIMRRPRRA